MKISRACLACRRRKVKCLYENEGPCKYCISINEDDTCVLYTTREYIKMRNLEQSINDKPNEFILNDKQIEKAVSISLLNHPELLFLTFSKDLNYLVLFSTYLLSTPFTNKSNKKKNFEMLKKLESNVFNELQSNINDLISTLQYLIIMLLIYWQAGKTFKGYLIGGMAERTYKLLYRENIESLPFLKKELFLRTIWSYQLITLSLRDESSNDVKKRLHKFQLPFSNGNDNLTFIKDIDVSTTNDFTSLLILSSETWLDCLNWISNGGKYYYKEAPWNTSSEWFQLNNKISEIQNNLPNDNKFSLENINLSFHNNYNSLYCSFHLTLLISKIILHREFIPFIPSDNTGAKGPFDKLPWLNNAPTDWWKNSAKVCFQSACDVATILQRCRLNDKKYTCNLFNGFIGLTSGTLLSYIQHFPHYVDHIEDANIYYNECVEYLKYYKEFLNIGSYYFKVLEQNDKIFDLAVEKGISFSIISTMERMKDDLLDIANISVPVNEESKEKVESFIQNAKQEQMKGFQFRFQQQLPDQLFPTNEKMGNFANNFTNEPVNTISSSETEFHKTFNPALSLNDDTSMSAVEKQLLSEWSQLMNWDISTLK